MVLFFLLLIDMPKAGTVIVRARHVGSWSPSRLLDVRSVPAAFVKPTVLGKAAAASVAGLLGVAMLGGTWPGAMAWAGVVDARTLVPPLEVAAVGSTVAASLHYLYHWRATFPDVALYNNNNNNNNKANDTNNNETTNTNDSEESDAENQRR